MYRERPLSISYLLRLQQDVILAYWPDSFSFGMVGSHKQGNVGQDKTDN